MRKQEVVSGSGGGGRFSGRRRVDRVKVFLSLRLLWHRTVVEEERGREDMETDTTRQQTFCGLERSAVERFFKGGSRNINRLPYLK